MTQRGYVKKSKAELLDAIDKCVSISQLFAIVQHEEIDMRMQSFSSASCLPPKPIEVSPSELRESPLTRLKDAIKERVEYTR